MKWVKRGYYDSISDVVKANSGLSEEELVNPQSVPPEDIENLVFAASELRKAIQAGEEISVMGDYDADGVTSTAILALLITRLGSTPHLRLPKRMSEGYGLSVKAINEFNTGLLITVDNGIAAHKAISAAKEKGMKVIVLDHHMPQDTLPCADIIVDPHVNPDNNGFVEYCGAGLAYKLTQLLIDDNEFLEQMRALAAIGTIADSMPLVSDNRRIVKDGLQTIRAGIHILPGLKALLKVAEVYDIDETDIGFKLGPMINAAGRMLDDGAMLALNTLLAETYELGLAYAEELKSLNDKRKETTSLTEMYVNDVIKENHLENTKPLCVLAEGIPEGIVGIITGRIAEKYKTPAIILTTTENPDLYKGSGRSYGNFNLMATIEAARNVLNTAGGHAGAAGLSVLSKNFNAMLSLMQASMVDYQPPEIDVVEYDLEVKASELEKCYQEIQKYAPYGQGNPMPRILITNIVLSPRNGSAVKYMGQQQQHIKLLANNYSVLCFDKAQEYKDMGCPINIDVIGNLSMNVFRDKAELQLEALDFREYKNPNLNKPSSLAEALRMNGTI